MEEEASPMEEDLWIEQWEALQIEVPQEVRPLSPMNLSTRIQAIVEEDLILRAGEFGIWIWLDDEINDDNHLLITSAKWEISDQETKNFGHHNFFQGINDQNW